MIIQPPFVYQIPQIPNPKPIMQIQFFKFIFLLDGRELTFKAAAESESAAEIKLAEYYDGRKIEIKGVEIGRWKAEV